MTSWFRSWHGAPTDPKWRTIARRAGVRAGDVAAVYWTLLDRASQATDRGSVCGCDPEVIADALGFNENDVANTIQAMRDKGVILDDRIAAWDTYQPKREDDSTERVRSHRERKKRDVTHSNAPEERRVEKSREDIANIREVQSTDAGRASAPLAPEKMAMRFDWQPSAKSVATAVEWGIAEEFIPEVVEDFVTYWLERPKEKRPGWDRTFVNRVRDVADQYRKRARSTPGQNGRPIGKQTTTEMILEAGKRVQERHDERGRNQPSDSPDRRSLRAENESRGPRHGADDRGLGDRAGGRAVDTVWRERGPLVAEE